MKWLEINGQYESIQKILIHLEKQNLGQQNMNRKPLKLEIYFDKIK